MYFCSSELVMMKIFVFATAFFISFAVNASGEAVCQSSITCDYDSGVCDTPSAWTIEPDQAGEDFPNQTTIGLSKIEGHKTFDKKSTYSPVLLICRYAYGEHSEIAIYTRVNALTGSNWVFSGFGKYKAECSDITDPSECRGIDQVDN